MLASDACPSLSSGRGQKPLPWKKKKTYGGLVNSHSPRVAPELPASVPGLASPRSEPSRANVRWREESLVAPGRHAKYENSRVLYVLFIVFPTEGDGGPDSKGPRGIGGQHPSILFAGESSSNLCEQVTFNDVLNRSKCIKIKSKFIE